MAAKKTFDSHLPPRSTGDVDLRRRLVRVREPAKPKRFRREHGRERTCVPPRLQVGETRRDPSPSPPVRLYPSYALATALGQPQPGRRADGLEIVRKTALEAAAEFDTAASVCSPSVAKNGDVVLYTGNWFTAISNDGGATFAWIDPFLPFPLESTTMFARDQVVHYVPSIDMFVWVLTYTPNRNFENIVRLAFGETASIRNGHWRYMDFTCAAADLYMQYLAAADVAVGKNRLYLTFAGWDGEYWASSSVLRIPLSSLVGGRAKARYFKTADCFYARVAQGCGSTAYIAGHLDTSTLRVWHWPEAAASPTWRDVPVANFAGDGFVSRTPDGHNWLRDSDARVRSGTLAGDEVWFAWNVGKGGANDRPHPYVMVARIRTSTLELIETIDVWDPDSATAYPALATNADGEVGLSYTIGGGGRHPSLVVALLSGARRDVVASAGARGPADNTWGAFTTLRCDHPNGRLFVAAGHTLEPRRGRAEGKADATPQFVHFGRAAEP